MEINYIAVLVSAVVFWIIGAVWYGVFSKQWLNAIDKKKEDLQNMKNMPTSWFPYPLSFVVIAIAMWTLAALKVELEYDTAGQGALLGFAAWGGFVATISLLHSGYEDKKWSLFLINGGYTLIGFVVGGAILGAW